MWFEIAIRHETGDESVRKLVTSLAVPATGSSPLASRLLATHAAGQIPRAQRPPRAGRRSYPSPAASPDAAGPSIARPQPAGVTGGNGIHTMPGEGWFARPSEIDPVR